MARPGWRAAKDGGHFDSFQSDNFGGRPTNFGGVRVGGTSCRHCIGAFEANIRYLTDPKLCDLSPVILDMLLERQGLNAQQCDTLAADATEPWRPDNDLDFEVWDLSGNDDRSLTEFAISDDDAELLRIFNSGTPIKRLMPKAQSSNNVRYIDLTGNPLTIDDVNFKNIPSTVAVILSADSNCQRISGYRIHGHRRRRQLCGGRVP